MITACAHIFRSLIKCFQKVCSCYCIWILSIIWSNWVFHYLFLLIFYHMMHIYICLHLQNLLHVLSIMIQQNLRSHSLLCCIFYIYLYAHLCCNTHMYILVGVVSGSSCTYNSLFCLISAFLMSCFPVRSTCPYQISM